MPKKQGPPMHVQCMDCGKTFKTRPWEPECPRCGSYDIDIVMTPDPPRRRQEEY